MWAQSPRFVEQSIGLNFSLPDLDIILRQIYFALFSLSIDVNSITALWRAIY